VKGIAMSAKKIFLEFLVGLIVSLVGFGSFAVLLQIPGISKLGVYLGGDKASVFVGLFLGLPIGAILGIFLLDKIAFKAQGCNTIGIGIGAALSFVLGGFGTLLLMSKLGGPAAFVAPLLYVLLALIGYTVALHK
jgi:hypothetical protein